MMKIDYLLGLTPALRKHSSRPEADPLTEDDALQEAQLLDIRFDAIAGVVGILFELRQALQLREANTGVLVAHGVSELTWSGLPRHTTLTAWSVGTSRPQVTEGTFGLSLVMWPHPGAQMTLAAANAGFFVGDVPDLSAAPPDYTGLDRASVGGEIANWSSIFEPVSAVFLDPAPNARGG